MGNLPRAMILIPENSFPDLRKGPPMVIECWPCRSWLEFCGPHILDRGGFLVSAAGSLFPLAPVSNPFPVEMTYERS